jgi:TolB-like protein/Tfp pilus assembly protein PilF
MSFFAELKRRNVFRVGAAYLVVAWLLMQVTDTVVPALHLPSWIVTAVVLLLIVGLPLALLFAWAFELTAQGLKREAEVQPAKSTTRQTRHKLDYLIIGALVLALGYFTYDKLLLGPQREAALVENTTQTLQKQAAAAADAQRSIAVLPFVNMSADPEQQYFVDGLAEELLNLLASIPELRVAARTSSFSFRGEDVDIQTIAEKLGVAHILEGSVRKSAGTLRITAQLIEADSGYHLWSQQFDRQLEDVFAIQEEIAAAVVDALKISLLDTLPKVEEIDAEAYAFYLQGVYFGDRWTREGLEKAVGAFQAALKLEPDYARAWAALAEAYSAQVSSAYRDAAEGTALARAAVDRALILDDGFAQAYAVMAWIKMNHEWDWPGAEEAMQRAMALEPDAAYVLGVASVLARTLGRLDEAIALNRRAIELSPLDRALHFNNGWNLIAVGQLDEAAATFRHVLELNPEAPAVHSSLGQIFLLQNQPQGALAEMEQETEPRERDFGTALALSALGHRAEADRALAAFIEEHGETSAYSIAAIYAWRGDTDMAFLWLDKAYEQRDSFLGGMLMDPLLNGLQSDARWPAFLDKMGLPH